MNTNKHIKAEILKAVSKQTKVLREQLDRIECRQLDRMEDQHQKHDREMAEWTGLIDEQITELKGYVTSLSDFIHDRAKKQDNGKESKEEQSPDDMVRIRMVFKSNYLDMFIRKGWLQPHDVLWIEKHRNWHGRHECAAEVKRKHLPEFDCYCSAKPERL